MMFSSLQAMTMRNRTGAPGFAKNEERKAAARPNRKGWGAHFMAAIIPALCFFISGCATPPPIAKASGEPDPQILNVGDVVKVSFPGNQGLETTQQIRRDGKINLEMVGEVKAADKTPVELEKELTTLFSTQLVSKEIKVTVVSSSFSVFVIGAVMKPGKLQLDRAVTAFDAIMEAGGFDMEKANMRGVVVIRQEGGTNVNFKINLKKVLDGKPMEPFKLKPYDTVYVPEKFTWF